MKNSGCMGSTARGMSGRRGHWILGSAVLALLVFPGVRVHAFNLYRLGGEDGNPWQAALSDQPGAYVILDSAGGVEDRVSVGTPATYATWNETLAVFVDSVGGNWLRPFWVPDTLNLARDGVRDRVARGLYDNVATSDGCSEQSSSVFRVEPMFDGDPNTAAFFTASGSEDPQITYGFFVQNAIVDLGADYPVNRIRFFPRLGRNNPRLDELLGAMNPPRLEREELGEEDFSDNLLPWYEVSGANSARSFAAHCTWRTAQNPWFRSMRFGRAGIDPLLTTLRTDTENTDAVVDFRFTLQQFQWLAIRPIRPRENWEIAEFQVFGEGYVRRAIYTSTILDWGENVALGRIRWQGERDENARVIIQTRSGTDPEPNRYWLATAVPNEFREIMREEYERASLSERRITLDEEHWSFWSPPYEWNAGRRDSTVEEQLWLDGTPLLSPSPSRYFQLRIAFLSTPEESARVRSLDIQFSDLAADEVVAEIWPLDASRTESTRFTYSLRPSLTDANLGFDRLEIFTLVRVDAVRSVRVDEVEVIEQFPPEILDDRIVVGFPKLRGGGDTFKLIEVEFDTRVVRYGTEFQGWIFASDANAVKQLVQPGNATLEFPGDALGVRTGSLGAGLLARVEVVPSPFTPNGDGVNDVVQFRFQLHEVTAPRALSLRIYDLGGRIIRRFASERVVHGLFDEATQGLFWDGLDDGGDRVAPGVYLYRLSLDADRGDEERLGTIAVSY